MKNKLVSLGKPIENQTLVQLVLNGLPRSYERTSQAMSNEDVIPTFSQVTSQLLTEAHRMKLRSKQLGDEEALVANFTKMHMRGRGHY